MTTDEALALLRQAAPANADLLDDLKDRLTAERPIPLVPFIGAGLSVPMGFPGWTDILTGLAQDCGQSTQVAALLAANQYEEAAGLYEEAAGLLEAALSPTIFHKRITHTFGARKSNECKPRGAILALPDLAPGPVVTTNFDRLLERVFAEAGAPFEHVAWGAQVDSIRKAAAENKPFLLKIHGDAEERTNRILTKSEYDRHYAPGDPQGLRAQLARVFSGRTLLFLGCSLGPDRTLDVLLEIANQTAGHEHFALLARPATDPEFYTKQKWLGGRGILPIWFPPGRFDVIEPFLRWIASLQPSGRTAAPGLVLERPAQRKHELRSELDLLIPYQRTTALLGRDEDLSSLNAWLRSPAPVSVRVLTGGGGSGKTRLAIDLIENLEAAEPNQWDCGFLAAAEMKRFSGLVNLSQWPRRKPVLAVIDYAAGSADPLRTWLEQLSAAEPGNAKSRLLLLEREASWEEGWLASIAARGFSTSGVRALFDPPEPVRLRPLSESLDRRAVLRATLQAAAKYRSRPAPRIPDSGLNESFDRQLAEARWGDPLTLMMAALTAMESGLADALALNRRDLAFRLADRELSRIKDFGQGAPEGLMRHMAAYVTVSGGLQPEELLAAAKRESEQTGWQHPTGPRSLADRVAEALRGTDGARPVEPDIVGEALLIQVWKAGQAQGTHAILRASASRPTQVAASVIRTATDFCIGEEPRQEPLAWLDALIDQGKQNPSLLVILENALPHQTLALRERAVQIDSLLADWLANPSRADDREASSATSPGFSQSAHQAAIANNLSVRLSQLGRREEALEQAQEAVRLYSQLAQQRPDAFLPYLAASLNNLALMLSDLGRREEALEQAQEAVRLRRQLAQQRPDAFLPALALSLNNLANMLSDLGRREEALEQAQEAVRLYRQLAQQRPDAFLPDLATSLNNLANMLSDLGRREEALEHAQEAVRLYRQLAQQRPDAFLPYLAGSLNNLAAMLSGLGRREEALEQAQEAVRLYRQLAQQRPDAFLPDLAISLNNLANRLSDLGRREEALEQAQEAVRLRRQLAQQRPDAFLPDLAGSLNNLANMLSDLGRREEALEHAQEAVRLYRQLAQQRPDAFLPDLAASLNNLANMLGELGRREEALEQAQEAVRLRRQLAQQRPDAFLPDLAMSLNNLANRLSDLGRREEALEQAQEAVRLYRQLAQQRPDAFLPDLARSLAVTGNILAPDDPVHAIPRYEEAIRILTPAFLKLPQAHISLIGAIARDYLQAAQSARKEPDMALLLPIFQVFQELNSTQSENSSGDA